MRRVSPGVKSGSWSEVDPFAVIAFAEDGTNDVRDGGRGDEQADGSIQRHADIHEEGAAGLLLLIESMGLFFGTGFGSGRRSFFVHGGVLTQGSAFAG